MPTQELLRNEPHQMDQEPLQGEQPGFAETSPVTMAENREPSRLARFGDRMLQLVDHLAVFTALPTDASGYPSDHRPQQHGPHLISELWYKG